MKTLLEFYLRHLEFLYLDPRYRITNSRTTGVATNNASLVLTGPVLSWSIANDRGQIQFDVAPTARADSGDSWFRISLVRQFMDGVDESAPVSVDATVFWIRENLERIEELFSDANVNRSCEELINLARALADKYWGPAVSR
ncbi:Uncharacterised protein [Mycobacteroides abscessus subsp. bolletii]|uniref:hypothetical protein n=1 Tax=Mycobacteroides abscessus TaxID=36809 RepID=UPI0009296C48|nr:hypothetical protein [Mycobacteroides abscessus]SHQ27625.1 Uncharacterised protein [Mycobacteroides abscessus subsp. abscessus]SHQ33422.1 Uncharacterised protein [Mycobacteroides abscessus subsp. abscessus]SHQ42882.1 Uncharacterised protein [Mycobacteroides abscessus subsp. abscessus]SHQ62095.1 Uncharacterised protein [Mycobacteroides abscessus subsp. abscessus]SHR24281.1 Uncharacterised protein [Mycobacteroides abscessus subsp. abscessus]